MEEAEEDAADETERSAIPYTEEPLPAEDVISHTIEFTSGQPSDRKETSENHADPRQLCDVVHHLFNKHKKSHDPEKNWQPVPDQR